MPEEPTTEEAEQGEVSRTPSRWGRLRSAAARAGQTGASAASQAAAAASSTAASAGRATASAASTAAGATKDVAAKAATTARESTAAALAFLGQPELLAWSRQVTESTATIYDKALDANYLATHIGGGNHRLFDGGHDLVGAWQAVRSASVDDSFAQEVVGYTSALWKDVTTVKGLPFVTWSKDSFDACADWVATSVPGASRAWFTELVTFDAFEVLSASLGAASALFFLSRDDTERLAEILGSMGVVSTIGANPLLGVAVVVVAAYAYLVKKREFDGKRVGLGAGMAGVSLLVFATLGLPLLIELGIVIVVSKLLRDQVVGDGELMKWLRDRLRRSALVSIPQSVVPLTLLPGEAQVLQPAPLSGLSQLASEGWPSPQHYDPA